MRRTRKAKIVATLGPASSTIEKVESLFLAGVDVFRLNFSHGNHSDHKLRYDMVRAVEKKYQRPIGVLADMQGPKLRVGKFEDDKVTLETGQNFRLDMSEKLGTSTRAPLLHPEVYSALDVGTDLLLNDGRLRLRVQKHGNNFADTTVIVGGVLSNHKGLNVPGAFLPISPLTTKDLEDLHFALDMGADWIALSFVQKASDVTEARKIIHKHRRGNEVKLLSKLEKPLAIEHLDGIVEFSDAIMVARGDLGVECPPETVPSLQKRIVRACRLAGKPVVVATQMLDSMENAPAPTRAEASDVATAIYDGADAVMLSGETASGKYPKEAVTMMNKIIEHVEKDPYYHTLLSASHFVPEATTRDAISNAASSVAQTLSVCAIACLTSSGSTTLRVTRERPRQPILNLTADYAVARCLTLAWGVHSVQIEEIHNENEMADIARKVAIEQNFATKGELLVIVAGVPFGHSGTTNMLRVAQV